MPKGPPGVHRPTQRRFPGWGDKWKRQFPFLHPLQPPGLGGDSVPPGSPAARSGLAGQEAAAGDAAPQGRGRGARGGGPGAGEAGPGAAFTSSTVSGMQIRYSFSSMVLPAADPRSWKRGRPPRKQGCRPGAGQSAGSPALGAGGRSGPGGALSSCLPALRPRACQGLGPVFAAPPPPSQPRSVLPERSVSKSGRKGRSPAGNRSDPQPGAVGAAVRSGHARWRAREGKKKRFPKIKANAQKSPARSASETRHEPGDPPSQAGLPNANSPGTHCSRGWRC